MLSTDNIINFSKLCGQKLQGNSISRGMKLEPLRKDSLELQSAVSKKFKDIRCVPIKLNGAHANLTERTAANSAVDPEIIRSLPGYTDENGKILPYLFVESFASEEKGCGNGKKAFLEIIKLAKERYGGRLLLKPENRDCNPSPFYYKCGLLSSTTQGTKEIEDYLIRGIPFKSGYSDPMYLPIEHC